MGEAVLKNENQSFKRFVNPNTGQVTSPESLNNALHQYVLLNQDGTGLLNASFQPIDFEEHEHYPHQVTVLFKDARAVSTWQSASGRSHRHVVRASQCYVVPSGQMHGLRIDQAGEAMNFYLTPSQITRAMPETDRGRSLELGDLQISDDPFICQLAATVRADRLTYGQASRLLIESAINVLTFHLVHHYVKGSAKVDHPGALPAKLLAQVKTFVEAEGTRDIAIADIAKTVGYSPIHFTRMFKRATGQTPRQYLISHRINHAKGLLRTTRLPIVVVAHQAGFSSHAHFSTQFRQIVGMTPQAYRLSCTEP